MKEMKGSSIVKSGEETDQTRSLFAFPIIRFWPLHYDFSDRLIDWSSFGKRFYLRQIGFPSRLFRVFDLRSGRNLCNIDKYGKAMQIYSSPIRRSLIESIERCQSLPKVSLAVNCNDILLQSDFMLITLLNWKRLTFCRSTWVLLWGQ